jgi:hypothetical protein
MCRDARKPAALGLALTVFFVWVYGWWTPFDGNGQYYWSLPTLPCAWVVVAGIAVWNVWAWLKWYTTPAAPKPGHCRSCGYDLTGNVSGRCPECGAPVAEAPKGNGLSSGPDGPC